MKVDKLTEQQISILWDMDGTLIDSADSHYESWRLAILEEGVELSYPMFTSCFGKNNHLSLRTYLGFEPDEALFTRIATRKENIFRELAPVHAAPFPGVVKWLQFFRAQKIKQAIASSAPPENIETVLKAHDLEQFFTKSIAGDKLPSKPAPDIFLLAASRMHVNPFDCVVMEDSQAGLDAGKTAGMLTVGLVTTQPAENLRADIILENYLGSAEEFLEKIMDLMKRT